MRLLDRLERKFRPYAVPNVTIIIIMGQVLAFILIQSDAEIVKKMVCVDLRSRRIRVPLMRSEEMKQLIDARIRGMSEAEQQEVNINKHNTHD